MANEMISQLEREPFSYMSFQQLIKTPIELEWVIQGMIAKGDSTLIHAPGGVGKSMLALYVALFLAAHKKDVSESSNKIFDTFSIPGTRCSLFIQAENSQVSMYTRIKAMYKGNPSLKNGLNKVFVLSQHEDTTITGERFSDKRFCQYLVEYILMIEKEQKCKIDLLIIDPLISYLGGNENDSVETRATLDGITMVCSKAKCTPIVIHHAKKGSKKKSSTQYRGSTAINDWSRNRISLTEQSGAKTIVSANSEGKIVISMSKSKLIRVTHEKCNNFEMFDSFLLEMDSNLNFKKAENQLSKKEVKDCKQVAQALSDIGGHAGSQNTLVKAYLKLSKASVATAKRHIKKAVKNGSIKQITTTKEGKETHEYSSLGK